MYSLKDLVLFNTESWFGLYQTVNDQYWPLYLVGLVWGVLAIYISFTQKSSQFILLFVVASGLWLLNAMIFHWGEHQQLSWVASYYGWAFIAQALLLFFCAFLTLISDQYHRKKQELTNNIVINSGRLLLFSALVIVPILGLIEGRDWTSLDVVGLGPDSTALATIGLVLLSFQTKVLKILLYFIPTLWLIISAATAWPMGLFQGLGCLLIWLLVIIFLYTYIKRQKTL